MNSKRVFFIAVLLLSLCVAGCPSQGGLKGLVPASGTVTYNSQPASGATVTFVPVNKSGDARTASAITDAGGGFVLKTLAQEGLYPGEYSVMVMKIEDNTNNTEEDIKSGKATKSEPKHLLPQKYASLTSTDIKVAIPDKGDKTIVIELK